MTNSAKASLSLALIASVACAPRLVVPTPPITPIDADPQQSVQWYISTFNVSTPTSPWSTFVNNLLTAGTDPVVDLMRSWHDYSREARAEADKLNSSRSRLNLLLRIGQFGGTGAATASSGLKEVDEGVGIAGGVAALLATIVDATGASTKKLERQKFCESLWFDKVLIDGFMTRYSLARAQNDNNAANAEAAAFSSWVDRVRATYAGCFGRVAP